MKKRSLLNKLISALIVLSLTLCFAACQTGNNSSDTTDSDAVQSDETITDGILSPDTSDSDSENETEAESDKEDASDSITEEDSDNVEEITDKKAVRSNTGTNLNLIVEYTSEKNSDGSYTVTAQIKLESYSLSVTARTNNNYLKIGDESYYFSTDAIDYSGDTKTVFEFGSHTFTIPAGQESAALYAVWYFNGTYSGQPIAAIIIDQEIELE